MTEAAKDTTRALAAAKEIFDGRSISADWSAILITLDQTIATVLLATMQGDARKAAEMLNEGTVPHVEERLALFGSKRKKGNG